MLNKTFLALSLAFFLAIYGFGCSQLTEEQKAQGRDDSLVTLSATMQLPVPDDTFTNPNGPSAAATTAGTENYRYLIDSLIDKVASSFRESNSHFIATVNDGSRSTVDGFRITNPSWHTDLTMTGDDPSAGLQWTYLIKGANYFTATTSGFGVVGTVKTASGAQLDWRSDLTAAGTGSKVITLSQGSFGRLTFTITAKAVELTGFINNGTLNIVAKWDATGGSYAVNGGTKSCWNADLQNATCPVEPPSKK